MPCSTHTGPCISQGLSLVPGSKWFTWSTFLFKTKWSLPDQNHSQTHHKSEQDSRILLNGSTKALDFKFLKQQIGQLAQTWVVLTWIIKPKIMGLVIKTGKKIPSAWCGMQNNWLLQQPWHIWADGRWKGLWGQSVCCFTVTQFLKGQELHDKKHLVYGTWMGKRVPCPCSLLQGPDALAPFLKAPLLLVTGVDLPCISPHRGSSKPRRSVTSHPSSSRTPPREILHPFHSGGPLSHSDSWLAWKLQKALALACKIQNKSNPLLQKI